MAIFKCSLDCIMCYNLEFCKKKYVPCDVLKENTCKDFMHIDDKFKELQKKLRP